MNPSFGRYELLKRIGGGGMGEVFLARQRGSDGPQQLVVVKTLLPHLSRDQEFVTMFKDEARVAAQLVHPNICRVFEFDEVDGVYYMAMEYLRGEDLRGLWRACELRGTPLPAPLICRIVSDAAGGLAFAHCLRDSRGEPYGIVHRDISPQNIFVTVEGEVKIIDFGVAKAAGRAQHTRPGALKGKYGYMSPERVSGLEADARSDIFALGIVLHELLTGRRLFKADTVMKTLARVRDCQVPPPSRLDPQLPPGLDAIVLKALAREPGQRYTTAQELRLALEDFLARERLGASPADLARFLGTLQAGRSDEGARQRPLPGAQAARIDRRGPPTSSEAGTAQGKGRVGASVTAIAATLLLTCAMVLFPRGKEVAPSAAAQRSGARLRVVTIVTDPPGADVYEGARLLGKSPKVWEGVSEGEHELTVRREGYKDQTGKVTVRGDGEDFRFRLSRLEPAQASR